MQKINFSTTINTPKEKVWKSWTTPQNIMQWNHASNDRHLL